jgi:hypothetical protein
MIQSLVGSVVIDVEFSGKDYGSIPATAIGEARNHLIPELSPKPDSIGGAKKKNKSLLIWSHIINVFPQVRHYDKFTIPFDYYYKQNITF